MKTSKILFFIFVHYLFIFSASASCFDSLCCFQNPEKWGIYGQVVGGVNFFDLKHIKTDAGYNAGGKVGYAFDEGFDIEVEILYHRASIHSLKEKEVKLNHLGGHITALSYMLNIAYHAEVNKFLHPFVGLGLGYLKFDEHWIYHRPIRYSDFYFQEIHKHQAKPDSFAWQFMVGALYPFSSHFEGSLDYQFQQVSQGYIHKINAGLTYIF